MMLYKNDIKLNIILRRLCFLTMIQLSNHVRIRFSHEKLQKKLFLKKCKKFLKTVKKYATFQHSRTSLSSKKKNSMTVL